VAGQHRNWALAQWRKARVVELAVAGRPYAAIAAEVGFAHRATAYKTVQRALAERAVAAVDQLRRLELDRLDALQAASWESAMSGDLPAVNTVLRVIEARARLLGLLDGPRPLTRDHFGRRVDRRVVIGE
jgi:hypothetical protein